MRRTVSHTTPLTILAELGVVGFAVYIWALGAVGWGLFQVTQRDRAIGLGLAAVLLVLFVHSLLYAGFFEDPLTWGVFALTSALLVSEPLVRPAEHAEGVTTPDTPRVLAH